MAIIKRSRSAQYPLVQEFVFNFNDIFPVLTALNSPQLLPDARGGNFTDFGSKTSLASGQAQLPAGNNFVVQPNTGANFFEIASLPLGAQITGGDVQVEIPYVGPSTVALQVGNPQSSAMFFASATLLQTVFTNAPTTLTNAGADPTVCTMGNATANGVTAVGQSISVSGCTGASAAYNGTFTVDSFSATQVIFTNPNLTTSLTLAGTLAAFFAPPRAALLIPGQITANPVLTAPAQDAARGLDVRGTLTFSGGQAATQGRVRVRIMYTIDGRANEVQPN